MAVTPFRVAAVSTAGGVNCQILQNNKNGKLWLLLRRNGNWGTDNCVFVLENFVRNNWCVLARPLRRDGSPLPTPDPCQSHVLHHVKLCVRLPSTRVRPTKRCARVRCERVTLPTC